MGTSCIFGIFRKRKHEQVIDLGKEHQMVLELRPSHDPNRTYGFAGVVISTKDLSLLYGYGVETTESGVQKR
jgi:methanethiol oxidase